PPSWDRWTCASGRRTGDPMIENGLYDFIYGISLWLMQVIAWPINNLLGWYGLGGWLISPGVVVFITTLLAALVVFIVGFLVSITFIWEERKVLGRLMDRRGTQVGFLGLFQNFADGLKTFIKEHIIPDDVDKQLFNLAPVLLIAMSCLMICLIPIGPDFYLADLQAGLLLVFAIFSLAPFAILMAGWSSNNKYTVMGGMRAAAQLIAYEVPILLSVAGVVVIVGSLNFMDIVAFQQENIWLIIPLFIGALVFFIGVIAEVERIPFDLPEAEAELVEGWMTEYGGFRWGLIMLSEYVRGFAASGVLVLLFLGGWAGPDFIWPEVWFLIKMFLVFALFIWVRGALMRVTTKQILGLGWTKLMPLALINLGIAIALKMGGWL
ncbi:MAG: NADH-quinone oxidoreductase subunit NuoH, partial [Methanomassiliicoccales archaeon]|nr:NADH-quinone oxidoreductase subunit NuoH [Methanomassiliicoccales archaeon]